VERQGLEYNRWCWVQDLGDCDELVEEYKQCIQESRFVNVIAGSARVSAFIAPGKFVTISGPSGPPDWLRPFRVVTWPAFPIYIAFRSLG
jgi:hypothetical protein